MKLRIKLFFWFIWLCFQYPFDIRENWSDMKTRYFLSTDEEMKKLTKEITDKL